MNIRVGKTFLIESLMANHGFTRDDATEAVNGVIEAMVTALRDGKQVSISNVGTLRTERRDERLARNPQTGETVLVGPSTYVHWRTSPTLIDVLSGRVERSSLASKAPKGTMSDKGRS